MVSRLQSREKVIFDGRNYTQYEQWNEIDMKELFTKVFVQLDNIFMSSVAKAFLKLYMIKTWFKETLYKSN